MKRKDFRKSPYDVSREANRRHAARAKMLSQMQWANEYLASEVSTVLRDELEIHELGFIANDEEGRIDGALVALVEVGNDNALMHFACTGDDFREDFKALCRLIKRYMGDDIPF